jgi:basic amino acid/polyamine antiporter, APA family
MLKKGISFFGVFSIAAGAMISSGIFILPGMAFDMAGPAVFVSYFLAGLLGLTGVLSIIELATAMPKAGGDIFFVNKVFGPLLGTIIGFMGWAALSLKSAFAIFGISEVIYLYTGIAHIITGVAFSGIFVFLNIAGISKAAKFQMILVTGLLSLLIIFIAFGVPEISMERYTPFIDNGPGRILVTTGFVFVTFGGLIQSINIAEEVKNPKRNIPLGIISSVVTVTLVYTVVTFVITGILEADEFRESMTPVADAGRVAMGAAGYIIITIASLTAFVTTANAGIMAAARNLLSMGRDRLLPRKIASTSRKFKTPVTAIIITGVIVILSLLLPLEMLVKSASSVILASFLLTNLAVIVLREGKIVNYKPAFKAPLYPFLQIFNILAFIYFIIYLGSEAIEITLGLILTGFIFYIFYGRKRQQREYALLHLLERVTAHELTEDILEDELREIIIDREGIEQDFFDNLIKEAEITDINGPETIEAVLENVVEKISGEADMDTDELLSRFLTRRKESNVCVADFTAIHHIVLEGEGKMFLKIIRSRNGIRFAGRKNEIKALFLVGGTREKRKAQFEALDCLVSVTEQKKFREKWLTAENHVELKNLLILCNRERL